jgi:hypothetical protein
VDDRDLERINAAVRECLSRCYSHENPLLAIAEYFEELKATGQWNDAELALVRARVSLLLRQLAGESDANKEEWQGGEHENDKR